MLELRSSGLYAPGGGVADLGPGIRGDREAKEAERRTGRRAGSASYTPGPGTCGRKRRGRGGDVREEMREGRGEKHGE